MKINKVSYRWSGNLTKRYWTDHIILHHRAGNGDVESIHSQHLNQGFTGIGYNFYIRKDGSVYEGRPIDCVGAHATNYNSRSVGVCFEGDFHSADKEMSEAQLNAGKELVKYLLGRYPNATIVGHRDVMATACPGQHFPFEHIIKGARNPETDIKEIANRLNTYGIVSDKSGLIAEVNADPDGRLYWFARKVLEYISALPYDKKRTVREYHSINDIVWEFANRKLISDTEGFSKELFACPDGRLYWLARKSLTFIRNRD